MDGIGRPGRTAAAIQFFGQFAERKEDARERACLSITWGSAMVATSSANGVSLRILRDHGHPGKAMSRPHLRRHLEVIAEPSLLSLAAKRDVRSKRVSVNDGAESDEAGIRPA